MKPWRELKAGMSQEAQRRADERTREMLQCKNCGHVWGAYEDTCHCNGGRCHNEPACLRKLRDITGCGQLDCRDALERTRWDLAKAEEHLRKKGTPNGHDEPCLVPPAGWSCSRRACHDGPCAARPASWLLPDLEDWLPDLKNTYITYEQAAEYMRSHHPRRACTPNETSMRDRQPPLESAAIEAARQKLRECGFKI